MLRGHFDSIAEVTGRTLKRTLRFATDRVTPQPCWFVNKTIRRGQQVTIIAGNRRHQRADEGPRRCPMAIQAI